MNNWQREVDRLIPELTETAKKSDSIYDFFGYLLRYWDKAAESTNRLVARQIIDFVTWCAESDEKDMWNAAGVSFLEHLPDQPKRLEFAEELLPSKYYEIAIDLAAGLAKRDAEKLAELTKSVDRYNKKHKRRIAIENLADFEKLTKVRHPSKKRQKRR
jgi:hypothetical protein